MTKPLIQMGEKVLGNKLRPCCSFELLRVQYFTSYILQFMGERSIWKSMIVCGDPQHARK